MLRTIKKLLVILVPGLFLIVPSQADDIRDFQIEGMSIGDSALDYFTEKEIKSFYRDDFPGSKKFYQLTILSSKLKIFDALTNGFKSSDKNYIIYSLGGALDFPNDIDGCLKKKDEILSEIKELFSEVSKNKSYTRKHDEDITGESKFHSTDFIFYTGESARIMCIDFSNKFEQDGYIDNLRVFINSTEYMKWIDEEAYK